MLLWEGSPEGRSKLFLQISELRFLGAPNYKNYECFYVPVVKYGEMDFRPPQKGIILRMGSTRAEGFTVFAGIPPQYDELVVFQEAHILIHSIVFMQP